MEEKVHEITHKILDVLAPVLREIWNERPPTIGEVAEICAGLACSILVVDEDSPEIKRLKYGAMLHHIVEWAQMDIPGIADEADRTIMLARMMMDRQQEGKK